jgi:DNA-binding XRE family transcriptional regulator
MQNEFIRMARFKLGDISQQQLADQLGCTKQTIHFAESGKRPAKIMLLLAIECLLRRANLHPVK